MNDFREPTKQQIKSRETKERIFQAAKRIIQKKGYEELSLKNICEEAGVSNGSFYHHFENKDDLLSYYIENQPSVDPDMLDIPTNVEEAKTAIIRVYLNYAEYCEELGVAFMSGYYNPRNQALNPVKRAERPYPIVTVRSYLEKAIIARVLPITLDLDQITTDIRMIIIGNVFEWCMRDGEIDFHGNIRRSLGTYLDGLFADM